MSITFRALLMRRIRVLKTTRMFSLEAALEYIEDDELVEVTPTRIRLRKTILKETDRRRAARRGA